MSLFKFKTHACARACVSYECECVCLGVGEHWCARTHIHVSVCVSEWVCVCVSECVIFALLV